MKNQDRTETAGPSVFLYSRGEPEGYALDECTVSIMRWPGVHPGLAYPGDDAEDGLYLFVGERCELGVAV